MTTAPTASPLVERARHLRGLLASDGPLARASIGTVPILWNNVDIAELRLGTRAEAILDDIARIGYDGCQLGLGFPEGDALRTTLAARELRLAEVYASIRATIDGPTAGALADVRDRLRLLVAGGGEVFCVALDGSPGRDEAASHAMDDDTPRMTEVYGEGGPPPEEVAQIPLGRIGTPREFGDVVCFLASDRAAYITGTPVLIDGGISRGLV